MSKCLPSLSSTVRSEKMFQCLERIGQGGPVPWPARSPDLNPLDFWLWGHLKAMVYAAPSMMYTH